jgi:hypothetical protein
MSSQLLGKVVVSGLRRVHAGRSSFTREISFGQRCPESFGFAEAAFGLRPSSLDDIAKIERPESKA